MSLRAALCAVLILVLFSSLTLTAQESSWTVAAAPYIVDTDQNLLNAEMKKTVQALTEDIPLLVLSKLSASLERLLLPDEIYRRELSGLLTAMQGLLTEYSSVLKKRDQQLFTALSGKEIQKKIAEQEKMLSAVSQKIDENLTAQKELQHRYKVQDKLNSRQQRIEKVVLYTSSTNGLYSIDNKKSPEELEAQISRDKIRGLITGSIKVIGDYLQITTRLSVFPKKTEYEPYQIMVHVAENEFAAAEISSYIMSLISNSLPSIVSFKIYPEEETNNASIFISDVYLKGSSSSTEILRGTYSIRIECPGFETVSFVYSINQNTTYDFSVQMKKQDLNPVTITNPHSTQGTMFLNAASFGSFPASITVNGQQYLGEFVSDEGWSNYFVYNSDNAKDQSAFALSYENRDVANYIEKSRNRLYISYAAVVLALPVYFYSNAMYKNLLTAGQRQIPVGGSLSDWNTISSISLGSVIVLGVNMGVQLALYLRDANAILPREQKYSKNKGK